jgi:transposase
MARTYPVVFRLNRQTLRQWVKQDRIDQGEAAGLTSSEREKLRREVTELRIKRELLVKAAALRAKETTR